MEKLGQGIYQHLFGLTDTDMSKKSGSVSIIGIGGAIGSGKSLVAGWFATHQATTIDLDRLSHDLTRKGKLLWKEMVTAFGPSFLNPKGEIQRKKLGKVIFKNWKALFLLNRVTHPILRNETRKQILRQPADSMIVIDGAVLYEAGFMPLIDFLIFVDAPQELRYTRLLQKGLSPEDARARMAGQKFINCLRRRSHIIIDNSTTLDQLRDTIDLVCELPMKRLTLSGLTPR